MSMREAFRRASEENLHSPLVPVIKGVNQIQAAERIRRIEERRFAQLRNQFYNLGQMWLDTKADLGIFRIPIEEKREQWLQSLTSLKERPPKERIELLKALASGMLMENGMPSSLVEEGLSDPLGYNLDAMLLGISFTPQSILFMEAISDMSSHSRKQKQEFRDFMIEKSGLTGRGVGLPQLLPAISRWLDHAK